MEIVEVNHISYSYNQQDNVIDDMSFIIHKGEYVSLIGHNGSCKSTLAKILVGLLPLKSGEIKIDGVVLDKKTISEIRKKVAIVFQNPDNQFIGATVEDDIAFGLENRFVPHDKMKELVDAYLKKVQMEEYRNSEPTFLSGGQKQRVAIAGALILSPKLLILDEACAMLSPKGKKDIEELINSLRKENKDLTIISITHDIEQTLSSDRIMVLEKGHIVFFDTPKELFSHLEILQRYKIDSPFEYLLKQKAKEYGIDLSSCKDIDDIIEVLCQYK